MRPKTDQERPAAQEPGSAAASPTPAAGDVRDDAQGGNGAQAAPPPDAASAAAPPAETPPAGQTPEQTQAAAAPARSGDPPPPAVPRADAAPSRGWFSGRNARLLLVLLLIIAGGVGYGSYWWVYLRGTVSTDDAYVDARIVSVAARLAERVDAVLVQEGDLVQPRQALARFAADKLRIRVNEASAQVRAAQSALDEARNSPRPEEIDVARAEVRVQEVELDLQQKEWERAQRLLRVKAVSDQEFERRRSAVSTARSQLDVSRGRLALLQAGSRREHIEQAEAALALAKSRLESARVDAEELELRSPVEGIVARRMVDAGEVAQAGQALFQVVETARTWVVANLEEDEISAIREGQPVRIWIDAYPGQEFAGKVGPLYAATLSRFSLLPSSSASGSFIKVTQRVPVRIDWAGAEMPPVYPGLNVVVRILVKQGGAATAAR